jgi:hypothetical protein
VYSEGSFKVFNLILSNQYSFPDHNSKDENNKGEKS